MALSKSLSGKSPSAMLGGGKGRNAPPVDIGKVLHTVQNLTLPVIMAVLVNYALVPFALLLVLLGKWRVFSVQPRHWIANIRTNTPDLIVGLSFLTFMVQSTAVNGLILSAVGYALWLLAIKPRSSLGMVSVQALTTQLLGLEALFWFADDISETLLVIAAWIISLTSARHFLSSFEEPLARVVSLIWALFVTQLAWLLNRWLIVYTLYRNIVVPQIVLVVGTVGFVAASLYYLHKEDRLRQNDARRYLIYGGAILFLIIAFSDWSAEL